MILSTRPLPTNALASRGEMRLRICAEVGRAKLLLSLHATKSIKTRLGRSLALPNDLGECSDFKLISVRSASAIKQAKDECAVSVYNAS
jgi:hypothetical protein